MALTGRAKYQCAKCQHVSVLKYDPEIKLPLPGDMRCGIQDCKGIVSLQEAEDNADVPPVQ